MPLTMVRHRGLGGRTLERLSRKNLRIFQWIVLLSAELVHSFEATSDRYRALLRRWAWGGYEVRFNVVV